eukprot:gene18041-12937_t
MPRPANASVAPVAAPAEWTTMAMIMVIAMVTDTVADLGLEPNLSETTTTNAIVAPATTAPAELSS